METLNYHHLRYFWVVAKEGSLAMAAERMRVSQPSISAQIRELETAFGQRLFRRAGRKNELTSAGQMVYRYAEEIFALGNELTSALSDPLAESALRLHVGLTSSFPKLVGNEILKPVFGLGRVVHLVCREGKQEDLLAQLAAHRLDLVLADNPAPSQLNLRVFDHRLGETGSLFCAVEEHAVRLAKEFPNSLDGAAALLPAETTPLRRAAETWLRARNLRPRVVAEFEDPALMKVMAAEGRGFVILPAASAGIALKRYGLRPFGHAPDCQVAFHAFTAERWIAHPAVTAIMASQRWLEVGV
jgi:LysR family transcriptional activator of nhaA